MTTRRQLIKTSLSLAAVPIGMSVAIEVAHAEDMPQWDKETDVLVLGYGNAGSNAAITAADAGAKVLILEKTAAGGGNVEGHDVRLTRHAAFHREGHIQRAAVHHGIGLSSGSVEGQYTGLFQTPLHPCVHSLYRLGASLCLFTLVVGRSRLGRRENPLAHVPLQFPVQRHTSLVCVHVDRGLFLYADFVSLVEASRS